MFYILRLLNTVTYISDEADYNKNGVIEFEEFLQMMTRDYGSNEIEAQLLDAFRYTINI